MINLDRRYLVNLVRWQRGTPRVGLSFPPLAPDHVAVDAACPLCPERLGNGARVVQLAAGPMDAHAAYLEKLGVEFTAGAYVAHEPCVRRLSDSELGIALHGLPSLQVND